MSQVHLRYRDQQQRPSTGQDRAHVAVEQPGARVVGDKVQTPGRAAQGADAVRVSAAILHHVAVPVDAVQIQQVTLRAARPRQCSECLPFAQSFLYEMFQPLIRLMAHVAQLLAW